MEHAEDRISSLPRDVIDSILERLSLREAMGTSILSRIWRNKWKSLSKINLSSHFDDETELETVIYHILLLRTSKIHTFHLYIPSELTRVPNIIPLMYHLSINGVKDLDIFNDVKQCVLLLPSFLFSCLELTHLSICGCVFKPPPDFSGFSSLISLECHNSQFKQVNFESFITTMPLLEVLGLYCCTGIGHLVVDAPNLKHLSIEKCNDITCLSFKNVDNVTTAYIQVYGSMKNTDETQTVSSVFTGFPKIEKLIIGDYGGSYLKLLAADGVPLCLPNPLNHLKFLKLSPISFSNIDLISCALCLISSCPNLQELHFTGTDSVDDDTSSVMSYLKQALSSHMHLYQLQKISVNGMRGANPELEIIKFLLVSSPTLKSLNVKFKKGVPADSMLRVTVELLSFQRVSREAQVIVTTPQ